jgi:LysM repeat protein
MKILKIFGVVVGIHVLALILIFADPGCSVGKSQPAATDNGAPPAAAPITPAPSESAPPISFSTGSAGAGSALYAPTRPGTPAATALEAQPVAGVTPAAAYVVANGDSLWSIAKRNHLKVSDLATANNLRSGSMLHPGQRLIIPGKPLPEASESGTPPAAGPARSRASGDAVHYVVKPGESLRAIAHRYHVKLSDIAAANSISDPKTIHPGQELIIPGGRLSAGSQPAAKPAPSPAPAAAPEPAPVPGPSQDLDAGLKPASNTDIPVVKVDDSQGQQK